MYWYLNVVLMFKFDFLGQICLSRASCGPKRPAVAPRDQLQTWRPDLSPPAGFDPPGRICPLRLDLTPPAGFVYSGRIYLSLARFVYFDQIYPLWLNLNLVTGHRL